MRSGQRLLDWIERTGNRLPEPAVLFLLATLAVMLLSQLAVGLGWSVTKTAAGGGPGPGAATVEAVGLLGSDGLWWLLSHLVENFINFPPLGLVLTGMLGIGLAERSGLIPALLQRGMTAVPAALLTPAMVFLGIMSSLALDAGYIVLPPLAAALYLALGRPPLAGLAAVFAGVSAGFSANLFITAVDPLLSGLTQAGAQVLDSTYQVAVTANWWFMIASTIVLTFTAWAVTAWIVEPRLQATSVTTKPAPVPVTPGSNERRALRIGLIAVALTLIGLLLLILVPGAPLYGQGTRFDRWVEAMVPMLFLFFFVPSLAYGFAAGTIRGNRDAARMLGETMASLGPYIVLAFFAAQFIAAFKHSNLGIMLAIAGGQTLAQAQLPPSLLIACFIVLVLLSNLFIGSASAKYALFAPVFVPMFMLAGISPELTQAAYRVGDSVSNIITPLNPYFIIVLAFMRKYAPESGLGTLVSVMLPYTVVFTIVWGLMLIAWMLAGVELGPGGVLVYPPGR